MEQTLSLIKPDAVERNLIGKILSVFEENNLMIKEMKKIHVNRQFAEKFYEMHKERPFFNDLCNFISSGPLVAIVLEGDNAIQKNRDLMGATNPSEAKEGTIRKMFAISIDKNSVHGSDSSESAKREIELFFN
jgi:nucleoside-diphosphate kinase